MRQRMPEQDRAERIHNFQEVALGYTPTQALAEANRCLKCKHPKCVEGCPVEIDIPTFIDYIAQGEFDLAIKRIKEKNNLPAICGRVCPQETQCEALCVLGKKDEPVAIGRLERFVADYELKQKSGFRGQGSEEEKLKTKNKQLKVAVIGSGPAGLTCAGDLAKLGYNVHIFESLHATGGVLRYGIPEFRLPKHILDIEIEYIKSLGVEILVNMVIGKVLTIDDLFQEGYKAVFIGTGAGLPLFLGIEGENLNGVYSANEFLTRVNLMCAYQFPRYDTPVRIGKRVGVVGGGNVAMDSARCALRLGAEEVYIIYRRSRIEMPAREEEIHHAEEEGIKFQILTLPVRIIGDSQGQVEKVECVEMELGEPDASGRRRPIPIPDSRFILPIDTMVIAIGQSPNPLLLKETPKLELTKEGTIVVDESGRTSMKGIYAGGDIVTGAATVISAMGAGKRAARAIHEDLS
ncbi:MAG: NADPH-dependent glutamate synthase [bacterium]|nr:NADPH-dependent glutamate synthase [bacterium]